MGGRSFLLADNIHINERNFGGLLRFCSNRNVDFVRPKTPILPLDAFGDYVAKAEALREWVQKLESLSATELYAISNRGINLFLVSRAELLSFICVKPSWIGTQYGASRHDICERAYSDQKQHLVLNMAAAATWIEFWYQETLKVPRLSYVGIFSGSLIYARALIEIMKFRQGRTFVLESFFTGKHYYCEERYEPIANRSDIRFDTVYNMLKLPEDRRIFEIKRNSALAAIANMRNKNVTQPEQTGRRLFSNGNPTLLILGQVLNDFSLL